MKENEMILERLQNVSEMLSEGMMTKDMLIKELFERNNENQESQSELNNLRHQLEERDQQYDNQVNKMRARLDSLFEVQIKILLKLNNWTC
jgi:predicted nuclease with TOPRIM domain